jgi:hypothetical protein
MQTGKIIPYTFLPDYIISHQTMEDFGKIQKKNRRWQQKRPRIDRYSGLRL